MTMRRSLALSLVPLTLLFAACAAGPDSGVDEDGSIASADEPIVGGAAESRFPSIGYLAWFKTNGSNLPDTDIGAKCTATVIARNAVITAAHCLVDRAQHDYGFGYGEFGVSALARPSKIVLHPGFVPGAVGHDVALLVFDHNLAVNPLNGIGVPPAVNDQLLAVGYGRITSGDDNVNTGYTNARKSAQVKVTGTSGGLVYTKGITGAVCYGDSGGPLLSQGGTRMYGVAALLDLPCSSTTTVQYTDLNAESGWINGVLANNPPAGDVALATAPAVASWASGRLDVVALDASGHMIHKWYQSGIGWSTWGDLGGNFVHTPAAVSWGPDRLDVFGVNTDGTLAHRAWTGASWTAWENLGGSLVSGVSAASWGPGHIAIVGRRADNAIWLKAWANGWSDWISLGGNASGNPSVTSWGLYNLFVFTPATDGTLWARSLVNLAWSSWTSMGTDKPSSSPASSSWAAGRVDLFTRSPAGRLQHRYYDSTFTSGWTAWNGLGGNGDISSAPASESWAPQRVDVFARDTKFHLVHKFWAGGWSAGWEEHPY